MERVKENIKTSPLKKWYEEDTGKKVEEMDEVWGSKVLSRFYGNKDFPIEWNGETEKKIHWVISDLHNPHPSSTLYAELFGWWDGEVAKGCEYMYRRFWAPIGTLWPGKLVNGYIYHGIIPPNPETIDASVKYYTTVMPIYANNFLNWWNDRILPEIKRNLSYLDNFPYEEKTLPELIVLFEDAIDIFDRHFKIHWILNLAQFQGFSTFKEVFAEVLGELDADLAGRILVSVDDLNWDTVKELWKLKEFVKGSPILKALFETDKDAEEIMAECENTKDGKEFLDRLHSFLDIFGWKSIYTHELMYPSWRENPKPVIEQIRSYLSMDYSAPKDTERCKDDQAAAIKEMWDMVERKNISENKKNKLKQAMDQAIIMAPLTPNHHFYIDQGTHQRMRRVAIEIGKKLVAAKVIDDKEDILFFKYNELRQICTDTESFDAKSILKRRKAEREAAERVIPPQFIGTVTDWSLHQEPYKQGLWGWDDEKLERAKKMIEEGLGSQIISQKVIKGIGASSGIAEGIAKIVLSPDEFDEVEDGTIMFCDMTNPAWAPVFPKLSGIVTNSGGLLAHPAIVSREFGIPCIVGSLIGTKVIKNGQKVRIDGTKGTVEILE